MHNGFVGADKGTYIHITMYIHMYTRIMYTESYELRPNKSSARRFVPLGKFAKPIQAKAVAVDGISLACVCVGNLVNITWMGVMNIDATDAKGFCDNKVTISRWAGWLLVIKEICTYIIFSHNLPTIFYI